MRGPFENAAFRRLFVGRVITNVGDSLYFIGAMWLAYSLTGDPFYTGLAGFLTMVPRAFQFLAGPLVDRWSLRRTLVGTQLAQALIVSTIPLVHLLGALTVWHVLVIMPLLSALNQLVYPAQSAALPRILDDEDLVAANSAFSVAYQGLDMVANGVGGVLIGVIGAVALFAIDAVTFGIAALVFATLSIPAADGTPDGESGTPAPGEATAERERSAPDAREAPDEATVPDGGRDAAADGTAPTEERGSYLARMREGVDAVRGTFLVPLIGAAVVANFAAGMVLASLPPYADALGVPPALSAIGVAGGYGLLMASFAAGTFLGALGASLIEDRPFGRTLVVGFACTGSLWTAGVLVDWLPATALLFALALVPIGVVNVQIAAIVQSAPPNELVGRVSSLLSSSVSALFPVGSLAGGVVAGAFGPRIAMAAFGVVACTQAGYVLARRDLRTLPAPAAATLDADPAGIN
ncbi:MFS transporter [Halovivax sp.]|uniref:MFS transporter n=1 Tax=Halovivax sp. TaxID=1935978 RepID=UPI0025C04E3D|nr:MFS transporter [Halovivax sp.]